MGPPSSFDSFVATWRRDLAGAWEEKRPPSPPEGSARPSNWTVALFVILTTVLAFPYVLGGSWLVATWADGSLVKAAVAFIAFGPLTYAVGLFVIVPIATAASGLHPPVAAELQ